MSPFYNPDQNNEEVEDLLGPSLRQTPRRPEPEPEPEPEPAPQPQPQPRPQARQPRRPRKPEGTYNAPPQPEQQPKRSAATIERESKRVRTLPTIDSRWIMFGGIVLLLFAAYLLISLLSTIFTSDSDQAVIVYNSLGQIVNTHGTVENSAGPVGAWLGNSLLTGSLGLGAFVIVFWLVVMGLSMLGVMKVRFWATTLKCLILAISVSIIVGLLTYATSSPIRLGGHHGYYVNKTLIEYASPFGAIAVSCGLAALVAVIFMTQISRAFAAMKARMAEFKAKQAATLKARQEAAAAAKAAAAATTPDNSATSEPSDNSDNPETSDNSNISDNSDISDNSEISDNSDAAEPEYRPRGAVIPVPEPPTPVELAAEELKIETKEIEEAEEISTEAYDPTADLSHFHFPSIDLLIDRQGSKVTVDTAEQEANKQRILNALAQFDIQIQSISATVGPTITLFEVVPAAGQRIQAIKRVEEDLALALKATGIRIIAPIPGKGTIGIEVPNNDPQTVSMRSIIASKKFQECTMELPMALGATISNEVFIADLAKMPHLLVAGATGQGKSVGLNAIITSLLYKKHPAELKFVLVDPKMVEFSLYRELERHYLAKLPDEEDAVITDPNKVVATLNSLCVLMDKRYALLSKAGCRGLKEYNAKFIQRRLNPEKGHEYMPYIVVIVDEFADLIMTAGKEVEAPICRLAQKARAVGIHVIIATQRPSTNVITGLIKANFPGRIAFRVSQMVDSKTILDRTGAHQLVGRGDMFFSTNGNLERVQCAFVDTPEVEAICQHIANEQGYPHAYDLPDYTPDLGENGAPQFGGAGGGGDRDPLFEECARFLVSSGDTASTSSLQRRYSIGYNRAGKIMDQLEAAGIVGPALGSKPRAILVDPMDLDRIFG